MGLIIFNHEIMMILTLIKSILIRMLKSPKKCSILHLKIHIVENCAHAPQKLLKTIKIY